MNETPLYFSNGTRNLFGIFHLPDVQIANGQGFIFLHPFAEEKLWTHMVYVNFARVLAEKGYTVLRFDFMGHGDSEGDFKDSDILTRLSDIDASINIFKQKVPSVERLGFLGLRFGASLAALASEKYSDMAKLILWEPILSGEKYMQELFRINLATQNAVYKKILHTREELARMLRDGQEVNVDGYEISLSLFEQMNEINLLAEPQKKFSGDCLIVQVGRNKKTKKNTEILSRSYQKVDLRLAIEEPFWKEIKTFYGRARNLYETTLEWLGE